MLKGGRDYNTVTFLLNKSIHFLIKKRCKNKDKNFLPVYHVNPSEVDESFADLQAEQH